MPLPVAGQIGPSAAWGSDGSNIELRQGRTGDLIATELQGRYFENCYRNQMFAAMNTAAQAISLTGTTTYTGLAVYNPAGSNKNLALLEAIFCPTIVATGVYAMMLFSQPIATGIPAGATVLPISTNLNAGSSSVARVMTSGTLAANPVILRPLYGFGWITAVAQNALGLKDELAGGIIVPPGSAVGFVALTTAITGLAYLSWAELPL